MKTQYLHPDGLPLERVSTLIWVASSGTRCGQDIQIETIDGKPIKNSSAFLNRVELLPGEHTIVGTASTSNFVDQRCSSTDRPIPATPPTNLAAGHFALKTQTAAHSCYTIGSLLKKTEQGWSWSDIHLINEWGDEIAIPDVNGRRACSQR
jgi:hypothetical protein